MNTIRHYIKSYASRLFKIMRDHGLEAFLVSVSATLVAGIIAFVAGHLYNASPHIDISESIYAGSGVNVEESNEYSILTHCITVSDIGEIGIPFIEFDIQNNSDRTIYFDDRNGVKIHIEEFIPLDKLVLYNPAGGAEDEWETPYQWFGILNPQNENCTAVPVSGKEYKEIKGELIPVSEGDMKRFQIYLTAEEYGYFLFNIELTYDFNNKSYTFKSEKYSYVYTPLEYTEFEYRYEPINAGVDYTGKASS